MIDNHTASQRWHATLREHWPVALSMLVLVALMVWAVSTLW